MDKSKIFVTGATGLVGSSLIVDFVRRGCPYEFVCLVRGAKGASAADRLGQALKDECAFEGCEELFDAVMDRVQVLEGDIISLDAAATAENPLLGGISKVLHCAADVNLGRDPSGRVFRANFEGTRNVVALARQLRVTEFHYVATAYVAGKSEGVVYEAPRKEGVGYNNAYEESKSKAEALVRESGLPFAIYRPGIIVGRSADGRIRRALAFYRIIEFLVKMKGKFASIAKSDPCDVVTMRINCATKASDAVYFTPIDLVQKSIGHLFQHFKPGTTYHVTGDSPVSAFEILKAVSRVMRVQGIEIGSSQNYGTPEEKLLTKCVGDLFPYFSTNITFDQTNIAAAWPEVRKWRYGARDLELMLRSFLKDHCAHTAWASALADMA